MAKLAIEDKIMDDDLKLCLYCGKPPQIIHDNIGGHHFWSVECANDDECQVKITTNDFETKAEAIKVWNTRDFC